MVDLIESASNSRYKLQPKCIDKKELIHFKSDISGASLIAAEEREATEIYPMESSEKSSSGSLVRPANDESSVNHDLADASAESSPALVQCRERRKKSAEDLDKSRLQCSSSLTLLGNSSDILAESSQTEETHNFSSGMKIPRQSERVCGGVQNAPAAGTLGIVREGIGAVSVAVLMVFAGAWWISQRMWRGS